MIILREFDLRCERATAAQQRPGYRAEFCARVKAWSENGRCVARLDGR